MVDIATMCAGLGHPGVTYNPWEDRTWCRCGTRTYPGLSEAVGQHLACCAGPLAANPERVA